MKTIRHTNSTDRLIINSREEHTAYLVLYLNKEAGKMTIETKSDRTYDHGMMTSFSKYFIEIGEGTNPHDSKINMLRRISQKLPNGILITNDAKYRQSRLLYEEKSDPVIVEDGENDNRKAYLIIVWDSESGCITMKISKNNNLNMTGRQFIVETGDGHTFEDAVFDIINKFSNNLTISGIIHVG